MSTISGPTPAVSTSANRLLPPRWKNDPAFSLHEGRNRLPSAQQRQFTTSELRAWSFPTGACYRLGHAPTGRSVCEGPTKRIDGRRHRKSLAGCSMSTRRAPSAKVCWIKVKTRPQLSMLKISRARTLLHVDVFVVLPMTRERVLSFPLMIDAVVAVEKASRELMAQFHEPAIDGWRDDSQLSLTYPTFGAMAAAGV